MSFFYDPFDDFELDDLLEEPFEEVMDLIRKPWAGARAFFLGLLGRDRVRRRDRYVRVRVAGEKRLTIDLAVLFFNRIQGVRALMLYLSLGLWLLSSQSIGFASSGDFYEFLVKTPVGILIVALFVVSGIFLEVWKEVQQSQKLRAVRPTKTTPRSDED